MDSEALAQYLETTNSQFKPWLLVQLRLRKLQEIQDQISAEEYGIRLADIHQDLMNLGEWWVGQEEDVFGESER
ncbi:hypothetical protein [Spirulina subsalsa]|uniref:hypothetical protein n=1 Tax=Spirulina subsalsa TaxID=54311 RepID=UPI0002D6B59C|nr:hypothetical protein [Spirulina subsalsa]